MYSNNLMFHCTYAFLLYFLGMWITWSLAHAATATTSATCCCRRGRMPIPASLFASTKWPSRVTTCLRYVFVRVLFVWGVCLCKRKFYCPCSFESSFKLQVAALLKLTPMRTCSTCTSGSTWSSAIANRARLVSRASTSSITCKTHDTLAKYISYYYLWLI